jgi:hypothetical protein
MEQAMKPQNDKINTLNTGLLKLVELWIAHLAEFVTYDREYARETTQQVANPDGTMATKTVPETFMFNPSILLNTPEMSATGPVMDEKGEPVTTKLHFKVKVDIGATLAMTKAYMMEIAFQLWQNKLIDIEGVYKLLPEFPGKAEALERMKAMQMQMQQPQGKYTPEQIEQFIQGLPEEILQVLDGMPEEERNQRILEMMEMPPEEMEGYIQQLVGGGGNETMPIVQ